MTADHFLETAIGQAILEAAMEEAAIAPEGATSAALGAARVAALEPLGGADALQAAAELCLPSFLERCEAHSLTEQMRFVFVHAFDLGATAQRIAQRRIDPLTPPTPEGH